MNLTITDVRVKSQKGIEILKGLSVQFEEGKLYAIMGPNGSGKSTLASTLAGHPGFEVTKGTITVNNLPGADNVETDVLRLSPEERARMGIFLAFQYPTAIPGVTLGTLLKHSIRAIEGRERARPMDINARIDRAIAALNVERSFLERYVNDNLSGGEKKKSEIIQLLCLEPNIAVLDETDSGLDVDALKTVSRGVQIARTRKPNMIVIVITHYQRILDHLKPDVVHILMDGRIVKTGGNDLVGKVELEGYVGIQQQEAGMMTYGL